MVAPILWISKKMRFKVPLTGEFLKEIKFGIGRLWSNLS